MDARHAANLLAILRPEIERAHALLEAATALQQVATAAPKEPHADGPA